VSSDSSYKQPFSSLLPHHHHLQITTMTNPTPGNTTPPPSCGTWDRSDPAQQALSRLINLKHDSTLHGISILSRDGVMRSLTADRRVVDAVGLTPAQIAMWIDRWPEGSRMRESEFDDGADGTKVPKVKWFLPDERLVPAPASEELRGEWERKRREKEERDPGCTERVREECMKKGMRFG